MEDRKPIPIGILGGGAAAVLLIGVLLGRGCSTSAGDGKSEEEGIITGLEDVPESQRPLAGVYVSLIKLHAENHSDDPGSIQWVEFRCVAEREPCFRDWVVWYRANNEYGALTRYKALASFPVGPEGKLSLLAGPEEFTQLPVGDEW